MFEKEVLAVYQKCGIKSFPIDCAKVLAGYGYETKNYIQASESSDQLRALRSYSTDAFTDHTRRIVYYNDAVNHTRIRFSMMHELGHVVLQTADDKKADCFASSILAPRAIIYARRLSNAEQIANYFNISITAANNVISDMRGLQNYYPDIYGADIIDHFGLRGSCPELFPIEEERKPVWPDKLPKIPEKTKEDKERQRKMVRSLRGKIQRLRVKLVTTDDPKEYAKAQKKLWEHEKHLSLVLGENPFEDVV